MNQDTRDLCSPSQLNLRFHCPGSAAQYKLLPKSDVDTTSEAAERGTKLHGIVADIIGGKPLESFMETLSAGDFEAVVWCVEKCEDLFARFEEKPIIKREFQIDLSELGISGGKEGCRIDLIIVIPGVGSIIVDFKFGTGYVSPPKYNKQFQAYAWGAWKAFGGQVECVKMQPAADEGKQYMACVFDEGDFERIGAEIKDVVEKAKCENPPLIRGPHCDYLYCKAHELCPLHRQAVLEIPQGITVANHLTQISSEERALLYENLKVAMAWCDNAIKIIVALTLEEKIVVDGYMIGEGRNTYEWEDPLGAEMRLAEYAEKIGVDPNDLIEPAHLKSKSEIEKLFVGGKEIKDILQTLLVAVPGKPMLKRKKGY
jgi:hypothetical protein